MSGCEVPGFTGNVQTAGGEATDKRWGDSTSVCAGLHRHADRPTFRTKWVKIDQRCRSQTATRVTADTVKLGL